MEWVRVVLVYAHLLASMLALAGVLTADLGLITGKLQRAQLHSATRSISALLVVLWATGLLLIGLDTGFQAPDLLSRSKLLVKLVAVSVLTLNGMVLHRLCFPILLSDSPLRSRDTLLLAITGSLSTMHWLLAAFIGVSTPLARLPFETLVLGYAALLMFTLGTAVLVCSWVRRRVLNWRKHAGRHFTSPPFDTSQPDATRVRRVFKPLRPSTRAEISGTTVEMRYRAPAPVEAEEMAAPVRRTRPMASGGVCVQ